MNIESLKIEKDIRKKLKLPITKQLVYYNTKKEKYNVKSYEILRQKKDCIVLVITLENNKKVNILLDYLRQMQLPNFIEIKQKEMMTYQ